MSLFEFVTVIIAMIFALGMGRLLRTISALVKQRERVRTYAPHSIWLACLFLFILSNWWSLWDFQELEWTYPAFFYVLMVPILSSSRSSS